jgi:hypothetical protein
MPQFVNLIYIMARIQWSVLFFMIRDRPVTQNIQVLLFWNSLKSQKLNKTNS